MKIRFALFNCFLAAIVLVGSFLLPCYADEPSWVEVRSPHFSVVTDGGEKRGREVAMRFEQMRSVFGALITKAKVNLPVPLQIVAFRNTKEFRQFAPLWHGKPTQLSGLFQSGEDRSFIMLDLSVENPWTVVFHEYAHQLLNGNTTQARDPWFEEGFAEYFSTIEVDNKEARVGKPSENAYLELRQNGWIKIVDLFSVRQNSQTYNEGDRRTVFYAESNLLMHYLYDNQLLPKVGLYFDLKIDKNVPVADAIQQAFGMSAAQLDKALQNYINSGRYKYYPIPTPPDIVTTGYTTTALSAADSSAVMADIHLHSLDYQDKAIAEFQEILKNNPNHAASLHGLGYAYMRKKQYDQAGDSFRRAAQLDSKDPRVHYYYARLMSREGGFADRSQLPQIITELETAIALDPNFADPYMLLGFAQISDGDPKKGVETMQKAILLNPRNESYQYNLAQAYMSNRQFDQGLAVLYTLEKTQNPELASRVRQSIAQAEQFRQTMQAYEQRQGSAVLRVSPAAGQSSDSVRPSIKTDDEKWQSGEDTRPVKYVQGIITAVDCTKPPVAVMTVVSGNTTWKLIVADMNRMTVHGADKFSCSWNKQKVGVNYRSSADGEGDVVWIGLQ